ncbi:MAG TPA: ribosome maturation factor RimM [Pyrinomonadaceae bacterium]|nr:ribosome maturation factor RimM [Pyrinomonadaceae bacterium]
MEELVAIAKLLKPRGLRGELVAELLTDFPERFENLETVIGVLPDGTRRDLRIADVWFQKDRVILRFEGIDSIEQAETLRNVEICVPESESVELDEDEFFDWQLEGCEVRTIDGESIGKVLKVMRTGGTENLVVDGDGKEYLIPFAGSICTEIDVEEKLIRVDLPEGLLEF